VKTYSWDEIPASEPRPGVRGRTIKGEKASISYFEMHPGTAAPRHDHDNEQINYVLEGELEFSSGDQVVILKAGQVVVFAPYETHMVRNVSAGMAKNLGVLSPPRHGDPK
jgi:quercetin dioxygenase-like cupin family protein